jgi:hypothetical protein
MRSAACDLPSGGMADAAAVFGQQHARGGSARENQVERSPRSGATKMRVLGRLRANRGHGDPRAELGAVVTLSRDADYTIAVVRPVDARGVKAADPIRLWGSGWR